MKIGITTILTDQGIRPDVLAKAVEDRGFESVFLPEHSHIPVCRATPYPFGEPLPKAYYRMWDPFVALSAMAAVTSTLTIGTGVALLVQRDVIHTAKEVASLDLLSDGRFIFGVGAGWNIEEMENHRTDPSSRGALLDERIDAMTTIWSSYEAEFHGKFEDFDPIYQWPKPKCEPHPPIYIGGTSEAAVRRAVRLGAGWMPTCVGDPGDAREQVEVLAQSGGLGLPITVIMVPRDARFIDAYADAGVERITLFLPVREERDSLHRLDNLAAVAETSGYLSR